MTGMIRFAIESPPPPPRSGRQAWHAGGKRWADVAGPLIRGAMKEKAPVGKGPAAGKFRDSIGYRTTVLASSIRLEFRSSVPHAPFVIDGTRPHVITPRTARMLHFTTGAGIEVFARRVNHPGTKANPFARRAVEPHLPQVQESFTTIMREALGGMP